ncbi:MAG: cardiolipin synthase [Planctomycetaceae bacterium]|nr:cardiolipin synthase [Planctomycetaceae bacterium]
MIDNWTFWAIVVAVFDIAIAFATTMHAVLHKRETQSVIGWVGLIWLSPLLGSLLYCAFGVNRIQRKGGRILRSMDLQFRDAIISGQFMDDAANRELPFGGKLAGVAAHLTGKALLGGNSVTPLVGGELAYHLMLQAIEEAEKSVTLCSYIFDYDEAGRKFVDALERAQQRGVSVKVLIDDVGSRYSKPRTTTELKRRGVQVETFLPTLVPALTMYANLRNHRKMMVVDGRLGFTGGMNIREGCYSDFPSAHPIQDIHFRVTGPVVTHIQETFLADWAFVTGEELQGPLWFTPPERCGDVLARGIPDGPDANFDHLRLIILASLGLAQKRIDVVTPYFLPDDTLIQGLILAAMRGVRVRVVVPRKNNLRFVQWASSDPISRILEQGCEVYESDPPFDHTKLLLVDEEWSLIGSSNWDPRSLRLNFEFNIECYDQDLSHDLTMLIDKKVENGERMTLDRLKARPLYARVRDGVVRMAIPYL